MEKQTSKKRWIAYGLVCLATIVQGMIGSGIYNSFSLQLTAIVGFCYFFLNFLDVVLFNNFIVFVNPFLYFPIKVLSTLPTQLWNANFTSTQPQLE